MVCDTCLGNNPYVRMTKLPFGQKTCKISLLPFQPYRWKAGTQGRYKETIIAMVVAKERSICQACLNDIKTGLPVGVRDAILGQQQSSSQQLQPMYGSVNLQYHYLNQIREQKGISDEPNGAQLIAESTHNPQGQQLLMQFAEKKKASENKHGGTAFRNLPKLCTFWLNGQCQRAKQKTCPYRPCCGVFLFPELLGTPEYRSIAEALSKRLEDEGADKVQRTMDKDTKQALRTVINAGNKNRDENIRQRVQGTDDLTKKYLNQLGLGHEQQSAQSVQAMPQAMQEAHSFDMQPPANNTNTTLWLGNIPQGIETQEIAGVLSYYGAVPSSIRLVNQPAAMMAFVQYADAQTAAEMIRRMQAPGQAVVIRGVVAKVSWAKSKATPTPSSSTAPHQQQQHQYYQAQAQQQAGAGIASYPYMPPPPGMERAPMSRYALPGLAPPLARPPPPPAGPPPQQDIEQQTTTGKRRHHEEGENADSNSRKKVHSEGSALLDYASSDE